MSEMSIGFSFLQRRSDSKGPRSLITKVSPTEEIRQSVLTILSTAKGERPLNPQYGSSLRQFIFRRQNEILKQEICEEVVRALSACEPRIEVVEVAAIESEVSAGLEVRVEYKIVSTGVVHSLRYPLGVLE